MKKIFYILVIFLSLVYLVNPGAGVVEFLPDNLPFLGNLDEIALTLLLFRTIRKFHEKKLDS